MNCTLDGGKTLFVDPSPRCDFIISINSGRNAGHLQETKWGHVQWRKTVSHALFISECF